jgi:hypothetical protein
MNHGEFLIREMLISIESRTRKAFNDIHILPAVG